MNKVVIGITGHRLLTPKQREKIKPVIRKALQNIVFTMNEQGESYSYVAISPLAEGADTLFANAAKNLAIPLQVLLPYERGEYLKGFSSDEARHEFELVYNEVPDASKRTLHKLNGREPHELFVELGYELVNTIDFLIAVWNEKDGKGKGGTADTVAYALKERKDILLINPENEHPCINYLHNDHKESYKTEGVVYPHETNHLAEFIIRKQKEYDAKAIRFNRRYKLVWTIGFITGLIEVLAFSVSIAFHMSMALHFLFSSVEFFCMLVIILLVIFGQSKHLHRNYVHFRIISERLRIKRFFCELGYRIYETAVSPIYFSIKAKPEFGILDSTIKLINLSAYSYWHFEQKKEHLETALITYQQQYHERKKEKYKKRNNTYKLVRSLLFLLFIGAVCVQYFLVTNEYLLRLPFDLTLFSNITLFLSLFIPPTIAACEALKYLYEWEKIITLSASMSAYFKGKSTKLKNVRTEAELESFLNTINRDMLTENLDWEKYMHDKNEVPR